MQIMQSLKIEIENLKNSFIIIFICPFHRVDLACFSLVIFLRSQLREPIKMSVRYRSSSASSMRAAIEKNSDADTGTIECQQGTSWSFSDEKWEIVYGDGERVTLIYSKNEEFGMRDFGLEVRPFIDISQFVTKSAIVLDESESSLDGILNKLFMKIMDVNGLEHLSVADMKDSVVAHISGDLLKQTIRGVGVLDNNVEFDQSWIVIMGNSAGLVKRSVAIARLKSPVNLGVHSPEVQYVILVMCPRKEKSTKSALETGLTFATLIADINFRQHLLRATTPEEFAKALLDQGQLISLEHASRNKTVGKQIDSKHTESAGQHEPVKATCLRFTFMEGVREDFVRRLRFYLSDFVDGVVGPKSIQKLVSTIFFLYFACLLPCIAFGSLNDKNTNGNLNVQKVILGQTIGGIFFSLFGGQPLLILLTTAPLALYTKTVYDISQVFNVSFFAMFGCVGLWNSFFVICYGIFDASKIMKWCTRSTEEIFALFITIAFFVDSFSHVHEDFQKNYYSLSCEERVNFTKLENKTIFMPLNSSLTAVLGNRIANLKNLSDVRDVSCHRETSILYLFLMFGTLWLGLFLYNFNKTPYLGANKRELLSDYSLPTAVLFLSLVGSYIFKDVKLGQFRYEPSNALFTVAPFHELTVGAIFTSMGLGFCLSILFFMDQNISAAMVNNPSNKLKKGPSYHFDLVVVAVLNGFLSVFCLPWMHAAIPHCPLHVRNLADVEERVDQGMVYQIIVKVRETRLSSLVAHVFIGLSLLLLPYPLAYIPTAVLDGLFLYVAITGLYGNQLFDRILLLFTEQSAYPPNHYIRRVPQRKIHLFTAIQLFQLACLCLFGFFPLAYVKMAFPLVLFLLIPIRYLITKRFISVKFLQALDGE